MLYIAKIAGSWHAERSIQSPHGLKINYILRDREPELSLTEVFPKRKPPRFVERNDIILKIYLRELFAGVMTVPTSGSWRPCSKWWCRIATR